MLKHYLYIFFISMLPLVELRGAIPVSQALDLPLLPSFIVCIIANILPVPLIYFFAKKLLLWGSKIKFFSRPCLFFMQKGKKAGDKLKKARFGILLSLILFVGIPLPGTGAWTGTLAASVLNLELKTVIIGVSLGVLLAGVIMSVGSYGVFFLIK